MQVIPWIVVGKTRNSSEFQMKKNIISLESCDLWEKLENARHFSEFMNNK